MYETGDGKFSSLLLSSTSSITPSSSNNLWVDPSGREDIAVSIAIGGSTLPKSFPCGELLIEDLLMIDGFHPQSSNVDEN